MIAIDRLYDLARKQFQLLSKEELDSLLDGIKIETLRKNSLLIETGEMQKDIPILLSGVLRGYLLDIDGRDITDSFIFRPGDIALHCYGIGDVSPINIESATECRIARIPVERVQEFLGKSPEMFREYHMHIMQILRQSWEGKMLMHRCSAMERYLWFLENYPGLIDTVGNKHIASFLGMTPVTLSRLRRKIRECEQTHEEKSTF